MLNCIMMSHHYISVRRMQRKQLPIMNFGFLTKLIKIYMLKNNSKSKHKEQKGTFYLLEAATYYTLKATNP